MSETEREIAIRQQEKFEFYLVALAFTLLALSIQSADFEGPVIARALEIVGWVSLLASGLSGLSYLEWLPVLRVHAVKKDDLDSNADQLRQQRSQGVENVHLLQNNSIVPIEERIREYGEAVNLLEQQDPILDKKSNLKYFIFKWGFVSGLILILAARAYEPIQSIYCAI